MEQKTIDLFKRLIESVILPKYPQIERVYDITAKGSSAGFYFFYVILILNKYEDASEIRDEIHDIFKMSGLNIPNKNTEAHRLGILNRLNVDFSY